MAGRTWLIDSNRIESIQPNHERRSSADEREPEPEPETGLENGANEMIGDGEEKAVDEDNDNQAEEEPSWNESQFLLDSQQLVEALSLCEDFLHIGSQDKEENTNNESSKNKQPCLADYTHLGTEEFKRDLEECQRIIPDPPNIELDTPPEFRLSQLPDDFGKLSVNEKVCSDSHFANDYNTPHVFGTAQEVSLAEISEVMYMEDEVQSIQPNHERRSSADELDPEPEPGLANGSNEMIGDEEEKAVDKDNENQAEEEPTWNESQFLLDSQQLVEALSLCEDLLQIGSQDKEENTNNESSNSL